MKRFDEGFPENTTAAHPRKTARSDHVLMPGFLLHPPAEGRAGLRFKDVPLPELAPEEDLFLLFHIGMSDGIQWQDESRPNGARFSVQVEGGLRFEEDVPETGWRFRAVRLTEEAGKPVEVVFQTEAINGNVSYDWSLYGRPRIVRVRGVSDPAHLPSKAALLGLIDRATHWEAFSFRDLEEIPTGSLLLAPWSYDVSLQEAGTSSPLVTADQGVSFFFRLKNEGEGGYPGEDRLTAALFAADTSNEEEAKTQLVTGPIPPGDERVLCWKANEVKPGEHLLRVQAKDQVVRDVPFLVFPKREETVEEARLENDRCRLTLCCDGKGRGFAVAETLSERSWRRAGSLYPLCQAVVAEPGGMRETLSLKIAEVRTSGDCVQMKGKFTDPRGRIWPVRMTWESARGEPGIRLVYELASPGDGGVLSFVGPSVLAGDRAFGAKKEFALFPGVDYLAGEEPSSSSRDLAPPLHQREVPLPYKITMPFMAVQGDQCLVALLWDPMQEWMDGERYPGARFVCPPLDGGRAICEMSLFLPSVGRYVPENATEAEEPVFLSNGEVLRLEAFLVLDHKDFYADDPLVRGPHRAALLLKAVEHWVDRFGLPEVSPAPREWSEQRALSRKAYLDTLWRDDAPGWADHTASEAQANVKLFPALLLDRGLGMPAAERRILEERMDSVLRRAMEEEGPSCLLSSNHVFLPFLVDHLAEGLKLFKQRAWGALGAREEGLWVWRPGDRQHRTLGVPGTHTLGQAAYPSLICLRAARFTGDPRLISEALLASEQMARYEIPRGASMWECPQYQPDILAASLAVKAYCEAFRLTGEERYLDHARYWAWTGIPFLYTWTWEEQPTMLYNSVGVIGSTFYTHSWLGRPVVWMGLDYATALQELAEYDDSFPWKTLALGLTRSCQWQQYETGPSQGLYPDSWEIADNRPNPADIMPILLQLNAYRLKGHSLHIRHERVRGHSQEAHLAAPCPIEKVKGSVEKGLLRFRLRPVLGLPGYAVLAQAPAPQEVSFEETPEELSAQPAWSYCPELEAVLFSYPEETETVSWRLRWRNGSQEVFNR